MILLRTISILAIVALSSSYRPKYKPVYKAEISTDSIILYMKELGIKHIGVVLQQIKLETWHLTFQGAPTLKECNNITAMRKARNRKTNNIGSVRKYAKYTNWRDCLKDYYYWQNQFGPIKTKIDYYKYLQRRRYSVAKKYIRTLKRVPLTGHEIELINK